MSKRILIIGSNGMLGQTLVKFALNKKYTVLAASFEDDSYIENLMYIKLDISNESMVKDLVLNTKPEIIINTAAYTNVDKSEIEKNLAYNINVNGVKYLSYYAHKINAHLIHISSDYVFDGLNGPYTEDDQPNPIGYYGLTKLLGETEIKNITTKYTIIRTNVLYGPAKYGRNDFVKWVYNSIKENKNIKIVTDQINNPTYLNDLAQAILTISENEIFGLFNIGGKEFLNRYEFTIRIADFFGLDKNLIIPILTKDLNQLAPRPLKSGLITKKAYQIFNYLPTEIEKSFEEMKQELNM